MKKRLIPLLLLFGLLATLLTGHVLAASQKPGDLKELYSQEWEILRLTNIERYKEGKHSLVTFETFGAAARTRAFENSIYFEASHYRPDGRDAISVLDDLGYNYTFAGENTAYADDVTGSNERAVEMWMNSPGHRAALLNSNFRYIGIGYATDRLEYHFYVQLFGNSSNSDCAEISFNANERYFTLKLKNGTIAYAPYDEKSVNIQGNQMQFHYPGATTWFDLPATDTTTLVGDAPQTTYDQYEQFGITPIYYNDLRKMMYYANHDVGNPFLALVFDLENCETSVFITNRIMRYAMNNDLHLYSFDMTRSGHYGKNALDSLKLSNDLGNPTNASIPALVYFDGQQVRYQVLDDAFKQDNLAALLTSWGLQEYSSVAPLKSDYPEYDFTVNFLSGLPTTGWEVGKQLPDVKPVFTDGLSHPYTLTSSNPSVIKINSTGKGFEVLTIGKANLIVTVQNGNWYTKTYIKEIQAYDSSKTGLYIDKLPNKTSYKVGETLDLTGLELTFLDADSKKLSYTNSKLTYVMSGEYVKQGAKLTKSGTITIQVRYETRWLTDFDIQVGATTTPTTPTTPNTLLTDGWYHLRAMNNYLNLTSKGDAELRKLSTNQAYYAENQGNGKITLKLADGTYLGLSGTLQNGNRLKAVSTPYSWNIYSENNNDIFSFRPSGNTKMVVNAANEKNTDGTYVIIWSHENLNAPNHAEFRFIPTTEPESAAQPTQPTTPTEPSGPAQSKHNFSDVSHGSYYENAVVWALQNGVTSGISATAFGPDVICNRGQVVTFLWRAKGSPEPKSSNNPFSDVKAADYFYKPVLWAVEQGITSGTSATTFSPQQECTSAQVITFLWRSNGKPAASGNSTLSTNYPGAFYTDALAWSDVGGLLHGTGKAFAPENHSPRADIVTYLYRNAGSPELT